MSLSATAVNLVLVTPVYTLPGFSLCVCRRYQRVGGGRSRTAPISRLYGRAELRLNVSLGQLIRNVVFEEAEPEFHQYAYFKTQIGTSHYTGRTSCALGLCGQRPVAGGFEMNQTASLWVRQRR